MTNRLAQLKQKRQQLDAQIKKAEAAQQTKERKQETRKKILVGAYFLAKARQEDTMEELKQQIDDYLTRSIDRVLFGLPVLGGENKRAESLSRRNADTNGSEARESVE